MTHYTKLRIDPYDLEKKVLKDKIKELKRSIASISDLREIWTADIQKLHFKKQAGYTAYLNELCDNLLTRYEAEIAKHQRQINHYQEVWKPTGITRSTNGVTDDQVARAKTFPIPDLIPVKRGVALCIFHDDHKPSMKYYAKDNRVYCFACTARADAIDVYMKLNGCDFKQAVKMMAP